MRLPASRWRGRARPGRPSPRTHTVLWRGRGQRGLSRLQGMPRRGGAWCGAPVGGQGGLGSRLCVRAGRGHTHVWDTYETYTVSGAGVGARVPWPPVLAILEGGVAVGHGRCPSAGRGAQGGAPAEEGGGTVHRHCVRCWPLPASPGPGRGARRASRAWSSAPGASPRRAPCPPDNEAQSRSTCLCRAVRRPQGLGGCSSGCWGCRSVPPLGGAGGGRGTAVLLRQGPPSVRVCAALAGVAVGAWMRLRGADRRGGEAGR